jgi:hypothetical protein
LKEPSVYVAYCYIDYECTMMVGQPWIGTAEQIERTYGSVPTDGGTIHLPAKSVRTWRV